MSVQRGANLVQLSIQGSNAAAALASLRKTLSGLGVSDHVSVELSEAISIDFGAKFRRISVL